MSIFITDRFLRPLPTPLSSTILITILGSVWANLCRIWVIEQYRPFRWAWRVYIVPKSVKSFKTFKDISDMVRLDDNVQILHKLAVSSDPGGKFLKV